MKSCYVRISFASRAFSSSSTPIFKRHLYVSLWEDLKKVTQEEEDSTNFTTAPGCFPSTLHNLHLTFPQNNGQHHRIMSWTVYTTVYSKKVIREFPSQCQICKENLLLLHSRPLGRRRAWNGGFLLTFIQDRSDRLCARGSFKREAELDPCCEL